MPSTLAIFSVELPHVDLWDKSHHRDVESAIHDTLSVVIVLSGVSFVLFDPTPKTKVSELFGREDELKKLRNIDTPISLLLGVRRVGKTSLVKVFLNLPDVQGIFVDCRRFSSTGVKISDLVHVLGNAFYLFSKKYATLIKMLKNLRSINIAGNEIEVARGSEEGVVEIFEVIDKWAGKRSKKVYIVFDEAQNLRFFRKAHGISFPEIFGYAYDNLKNLKIILTGSEAGVLKEFVGTDDSQSPLYGRYVEEMALEPFEFEKSKVFLEKGFDEVNFKYEEYQIIKVLSELDGIVGWLVYFGKSVLDSKGDWEEAMEKTLEIVAKIVNEELKNLAKLSTRYIYCLRAIALGVDNWGSIKKAVEFEEKKKLTDASFNRILKGLNKMGYVVKKNERYRVADPVIRKVVMNFHV